MPEASTNSTTISYRRILNLAWPASVASSVTPLLGAVDVWALARSPNPLDIAAVGLGAVIFSLAYWTFGFIRMSVAGMTAQAVGAEDETEARATLMRGAIIGGGIGALLVLFQIPIGWLAFQALAIDSNASADTFASARTYFEIRIWGAPFALATYAAFGWLTARERTDFLMIASIAMTALNIILDYWFVVELHWGAAGVAAGTLIAEIAGFFIAAGFVALILHKHGGVYAKWSTQTLLAAEKIRRTVSINFDIFIRTLLLAFCFAWFIQRSGAFGDVTLAANQALLQLFLFTGLALDGTAIAAETLVGQALGSKNIERGLARFQSAVRRTFLLAFAGAVAFALFYLITGAGLLALLTPPGDIRDVATRFLPWVIASPLMVVIGFQLDGIFIGATKVREMRDSMIVSSVVFIAASLWLAENFQNHGLWLSFSAYFMLRALTLGIYMPRLRAAFTD